jgi:hypothetical protein
MADMLNMTGSGDGFSTIKIFLHLPLNYQLFSDIKLMIKTCTLIALVHVSG